jgi:hypothetical protein
MYTHLTPYPGNSAPIFERGCMAGIIGKDDFG